MDRNITGIFTGDWEKAVVPYVGTWIEIALLPQQSALQLCRSLRGNVDRNSELVSARLYTLVVPYVGTWIEIYSVSIADLSKTGRSLRGNVDRNFLFSSFLSDFT